MARKLLCSARLSVVVLFIATLIALFGLAALAQTKSAGQPSAQRAVMSAQGIPAPAQSPQHPLLPGATAQHTTATERQSASAADQGDPLIFLPAVTYDSGGYTGLSVAVGDLNGDGKVDMVVGNRCAYRGCSPNGGSVAVLLGKGDGTFQSALAYSSGGMYAHSVAIADVNGDGKPDLLVSTNYMVCKDKTCWPTGAIAMLLGRGDGTFQPSVIYDSGGQYPYSIAVADFNGDGQLDVAAANSDSATVGVLLGNGDGTFQAAVTYGSGYPAYIQRSSVVVADVNNDGHPDLLLTTECAGDDFFDGGATSVLFGNADGTFQPAVTYPSGGYIARGVAVGDVNGDGRPDMLVASLCIVDDSLDCGGPINKVRGVVGVLLNNYGAPPTPMSLISSVNPAAVNWVVTYTATVTPQGGGTVNGTVTFTDGFLAVATLRLANNQVAYSTSYAKKGTHTITARYPGELNVAAGSASVPLDEVIKVQHQTKTTVTASGSPTYVGQAVTFTATVTSTYGPIPDGELITFYDGTSVMASVPLTGGTAAYSTSSLSAKTHYIRAKYVGDVNFAPSVGAVTQVVEKYPTTTTLASNPNPSTYGQTVTFTATITPSGPYAVTGKLKFWDGTTGIGTVTLSGGVATLKKSTLAVGTHAITAQYLADGYNAKSTSAVLDQVVQ